MGTRKACARVARVPSPLLPSDRSPRWRQPRARDGSFSWLRTAATALGLVALDKAVRPRSDRISYLTYLCEDIPSREVREQMGTWAYGCDRRQDVCPRNQPWLAQELPVNERVAARAALEGFLTHSGGRVREEVEQAIEGLRG